MNVLRIIEYNRRRALRRERLYRDHSNPLEKYDDSEIKKLFRFERENIHNIVNQLNVSLRRATGRSCSLPPLLQVCIALRFYGTGSMQLSLAAWVNVDQATVCRCIWDVTTAIIEHYPNVLTIQPQRVKDGFFERYKVPNVLGAIDCTHIRIKAPPEDQHPGEYINRKNYYSINVQAVCDSDSKFIDVVAAWPGGVHDSRIFKNSGIYRKLTNRQLNGVLFGDNGYGNSPICLTPFLNPTTAAENNYNQIHKTTRCTIERAFGQMKKRFYCMGSILRISLERIPSTIIVCFILHNLAKTYNDPDFLVDPIDEEPFDNDDFNYNDAYLRRLGEAKRRELVEFLFNL